MRGGASFAWQPLTPRRLLFLASFGRQRLLRAKTARGWARRKPPAQSSFGFSGGAFPLSGRGVLEFGQTGPQKRFFLCVHKNAPRKASPTWSNNRMSFACKEGRLLCALARESSRRNKARGKSCAQPAASGLSAAFLPSPAFPPALRHGVGASEGRSSPSLQDGKRRGPESGRRHSF